MAHRSRAWWNLPPALKLKLKQERVRGGYGGESSYSVGRAPYYWAQEHGKTSAEIKPQRFAAKTWSSFTGRAQTKFDNLVREHLA
jgi:hypothetical protein